ncbi:MAG TPA: RsmB/NOP family class I SAM-dependent RNA methyltransferase [Opitutaceae bacterium]
MSSEPVFNRAARILRSVSPDTPADEALRRELGAQRTLAPSEKRAVTRAVFAYYRWLRWLDSSASLQAQLAAAADLQRRFDADPASVKTEALAARAVPDWLRDELALTPDYLRSLQRDPALWIRVQTEFAGSVPRALGDCTAAPAPAAGTGFRYTGTKDLFRSEEFQKGLFEIQDLASQLVGHACAPQPGETWWDACAGEGGKTLHLADLMQNKGLIWATDRSARRLATLRRRAGRAQVFNYRSLPWNGGPFLPTKTKFDGILVDAPCSGVGTWQRNPHARWTTTADDVRELAALQLQLLNHVAGSLKPGGRLVYAVCTLTRSETTAVVDPFATAHPELEPLPLASLGAMQNTFVVQPHEWNANGMFIAAWTRKK